MNDKSWPILIAGLPRSGTTWVGEVLSSVSGTRYLFEPDNEGLSPLGWFYKRTLHRFPYLTTRDESVPYFQLWNTILNSSGWIWSVNNILGLYFRRWPTEMEATVGTKCGYVYTNREMHRVGEGWKKQHSPEKYPALEFFVRWLAGIKQRPARGGCVIVKSVHGSLSLDWISQHFPVRVIMVLRNPYSLYASYKRMKMPDRYRNLLFQERLNEDWLMFKPNAGRTFMTDRDDPIAFQIALMYKVLERQIAGHPDWMLISHDRLCIAPQNGFRRVFEEQGLSWGEATNAIIESLDKSGTGFVPKRVTNQQPFKWKNELGAEERAVIDRWTSVFELKDFYQMHIKP